MCAMDLFEGLQWFALQGETLAAAAADVHVDSAYLFNPGRSRVLRQDRARSGFIAFQGNILVLATPRECCARGIFPVPGALFAGLISDSILGRTKTFLLHLEGLFRTLLLKTPGTERYPLDAVLLLCLDLQNFTEDDFLTSLCERCVHGMSSRRRSAPPVFIDMDQDDQTLPFHPVPVEDAEDLNVPWTLHEASSMIRVTKALSSQLVSLIFIQMLIEWCDTPCLSLIFCENIEHFPSVSLGVFKFTLPVCVRSSSFQFPSLKFIAVISWWSR